MERPVDEQIEMLYAVRNLTDKIILLYTYLSGLVEHILFFYFFKDIKK
jgi:hypothetical protein